MNLSEEKQLLAAIDGSADGTFFWPTDTTQASGRIEYILILASPRMNVTPCTVWERSGDELQLAGTEARQDHRPIVIKMVDESAVQCR